MSYWKSVIFWAEIHWKSVSFWQKNRSGQSLDKIQQDVVPCMKNKKATHGDFLKWSSVDQGLLPALSGVVKTYILTPQR